MRATLLILFFSAVRSDRVVLENGGYQNVVISIQPDAPASQAEEILTGIRRFLTLGSEQLHESTENLAFLERVTVLAPNSWTRNDFSGFDTADSYDVSVQVIAN